jgi:hypothetical protein
MTAFLEILSSFWVWIRRSQAEKSALEAVQGKKIQASVDSDLATINSELAEPPKKPVPTPNSPIRVS